MPLWAAGTIINFGLNLFLIPRLGISGAAWASFITQVFINGLIWLKMKKINYFSIGKDLFPIILATGMMSVAVILVRQLNAPAAVVIATAIFAYFGSLLFSGEHPIRQLKEGLRGGK